LQRKCAHCEEEEKKKKPIMRKAEAGNSGMSVSTSFASSLNASEGVGSPLPQGTKSFMENAFSTDFSEVRIHTGSKASEMSRGINAKAFTYGSDIFFGEGQYNPGSGEGKHLLGHELTHVVQQNKNAIQPPSIQRITDEALEFRYNPPPPPNPTSPVEVTAIDDVDSVGWVESLFSIGEVNFNDVNTFVSNVIGNITTHPMSRLNVQVHGSTNSLVIGNTVVHMGNIANYSGVLSRLNGHFTSSGFVHLRACNVGNALPLVTEFSRIFGVAVYAATGTQRNLIIPFNMGNYVRCDPNGTCNTNVSRP
ncbi:MAG: DUF4157 domain-containing protein, partial [Chitinophagales bacterium]|nr:DUF4157 domain-containing protein [Chitinophagales bacterium]